MSRTQASLKLHSSQQGSRNGGQPVVLFFYFNFLFLVAPWQCAFEWCYCLVDWLSRLMVQDLK